MPLIAAIALAFVRDDTPEGPKAALREFPSHYI